MRYLGVDPGGRNVGLAVGEDVTGAATPIAVFPYRGVAAAARTIRDAAVAHAVDVVVVGWPADAEGVPTPACRRSEILLRELEELGVTVTHQTEFLSSNEARRRGRAAGLPNSSPVDHLAAQVLLEEYLATRSGRTR